MKISILLYSLLFLSAIIKAQEHAPSVKGVTPFPAEARSAHAGTRAVVIGISNYQNDAIPDLRFADKDAEAFANFLRSPAGGSLDADHLKVLTNEQATAGRIAQALDGLIEQAKAGEQVIIYFSGHSDVERKTMSQPGFLLAWDAPANVYMGGGTYSLAYLQEIVSTLSTQNMAKVVVITDACHAGKLAGSQFGGAQLTAASMVKQFSNEVKILSCQPNEFSVEGEQWGGGRGAFSFNLVDALYGLADGNHDLFVTLQEVGRYLEDHVTSEVAPMSQIPMVVGNRMERLAQVDANLVADLRAGRTSQMLMLSPIENRGMEDDILAQVDTSVRELYELFKKALKDKVFLEPVTACADAYYERLIKEPTLARLYSTMRRNYAAALQDDAQQAINIRLKADVQQLECIGTSLVLEPIPRLLERAAELLGKEHYMYHSLIARKLLFEAVILSSSNKNNDAHMKRQAVELCQKALQLEPESPIIWSQLSWSYLDLQQIDSSLICVDNAHNFAPAWVLPYTDLGFRLIMQGNSDLCKQVLLKAQAIDSLHPYVIALQANWHMLQNNQTDAEIALSMFERYRNIGGPMYSCWYVHYSNALKWMGKYAEAEEELRKAISMDSTFVVLWQNLGALMLETHRFAEAEQLNKKAISMDSTNVALWSNLGTVYLYSGRNDEALFVIKKAISLDSTNAYIWNNLANLYSNINNYAEAERLFLKVVSMDSTIPSLWNNFGLLYLKMNRLEDAEHVLRKSIAQNPGAFGSYKHLGMVCFKTNRPDEARQYFMKAIELYPDYAGAMLGMAYLASETLTKTDMSTAAKTTAAREAFDYVEQAIGKGATLKQLESEEDLAPLRALPEWKPLMKKYFPDKE